MTTILHRARRTVNRLGLDVARYQPSGTKLASLLQRHDIDVVLDVGAHRGRYGKMLREAGYRGRIVSFEPLHKPRRELHRRASFDDAWSVLPYALGDRKGTTTLNIAGDSGASSSILPMLPRHSAAAPDRAYTGGVTVETRRLDELWTRITEWGDRVFLKLDIQGYEIYALRGAGRYVNNLVGLQVEAPLVPLYEGGLLFDDMLDVAREGLGMTLMSVTPGFSDPSDGRMLQCDLVLFQEETSKSGEPGLALASPAKRIQAVR